MFLCLLSAASAFCRRDVGGGDGGWEDENEASVTSASEPSLFPNEELPLLFLLLIPP